MADCEDRLRGVLRAQAETFEPPDDLRDRINERTGEPTATGRWRVTMAAAACVALIAGALGAASVVGSRDGAETITAGPTSEATTGPDQPAAVDSWRQIAPAPISPRQDGSAVFTDEEMLIFGGTEDALCPPGSICDPPQLGRPLASGAAYDPAEDSWRTLSPAPVPFTSAPSVWTGERMLVLTNDRDALLAYAPGRDRWTTLAKPPTNLIWNSSNVWAGDQWVFAAGDTTGGGRDWSYDPVTDTWSELPPDPIGPAFTRSLVWTGEALLLFADPSTANAGSVGPSLFFGAARLNMETGRWRELPDSEVVATSTQWVSVGDLVVNPSIGSVDGGEVNPFERSYQEGGIYNTATGSWTRLPQPPARIAERPFGDGAPADLSDVDRADGWVVTDWMLFDPRAGRWHSIPVGPDAGRGGAMSVWTGSEMVTWGGVVSEPTERFGARVTGAGAAYRPPPTG